MPILSRVASLWRNLVRRARVERDLDDEMRAVLELLIVEKMRSGMRGAQARRSALLELRGVDSVKERVREARMGAWLDVLARDVRHAVRLLVRGRLFTVVAVLTIALGVGANGAIFGVVNGLLLQPLPYPEADRLVWIVSRTLESLNLAEWQDGMRSLERMGAFTLRTTVLTGRGPAERVEGMVVTEELLPLLGARAVVGRLWTEDEHRSGARAIVVSERFWNRIGFASTDPGNVHLMLSGEQWTIIGVLPADFQDLHYFSDVWFPAASQPASRLSIIGLRRSDTPVSVVQEEARALTSRLGTANATATSAPNVTSLPEFFRGEIRTRLLVLFAATALVLLIACANVANLLLSRGVGRRQEMAVRASLGAGKATLLRQLLTETTVLAIAGGLAGWILATIGLRLALRIAPEFYEFRRLDSVRLDHGVLAFSFAVAWISTMLAGLAPALRTANDAARAAAGWTRASAPRGARRAREALMAAEIALALVLLIGTLLLVRTFLVLRPASPGFEARHRMVTSVGRRATPADDAANVAFVRRLLEEVRAAAPSARVAVATDVPLSRSILNFRVVAVDGEPIERTDPLTAGPGNLDLVLATPGYLDLVGIPVIRGRALTDADRMGAPTALVISESTAQRYWSDANPIGRRITLNLREQMAEFTVAGVVGDTRSSGIHTRSRATAFASFWQVPWEGFELVVHQPRGLELAGDDVRRIIASVDPDVPVGATEMLDRIAARAVAGSRYDTMLMSLFAALAVTLALIGCYGVLAYSIAQRTREIGVRVALGASHRMIMRDVVLRGLAVVVIGLCVGVGLALALTRVLEGSLYGVTPTDPVTFATAVAGLFLVSLVAVWVPARRAVAIQPIEALRIE